MRGDARMARHAGRPSTAAEREHTTLAAMSGEETSFIQWRERNKEERKRSGSNGALLVGGAAVVLVLIVVAAFLLLR
jgi:hypothetical protein